jgi:hypothetical protein
MKKLLIALPVLALLLGWGYHGAQQAEAQVPAVDFYIEVATAGCDTDAGPTTCNVPVGTQFTVGTVIGSVSNLPDTDTDTTNGYVGIQAQLDNSASIPYQDRPGTNELDAYWPPCSFAVEDTSLPNTYIAACMSAILPPLPESTYTGKVMEVDYNCTASPTAGHTVTLVHGAPNGAGILDDGGGTVVDTDPNEVLTINCVEPTPTPSPTPTPAPGVGGMVELGGSSDAPAQASGSSSGSDYTALVAAAVLAAVVALTATGWYARRRWLR